jgi:hypothetical protein
MLTRPLHHLRRNVITYLALFLALGAGGGYAMAATKAKTIAACADKKTGVLHLKAHGKCSHSQTRVTWNQKGPQGATGLQGSAGAPGVPAVSVWAQVTNAGPLFSGQGLSVQHLSTGTYQVTITAPACAQRANAPVITVSDTNPPGGQAAGAFPVAWYQSTGGNQVFNVFTGVVAGGSFTPTDHAFTVMDTCM